jgi:hypothetical protein
VLELLVVGSVDTGQPSGASASRTDVDSFSYVLRSAVGDLLGQYLFREGLVTCHFFSRPRNWASLKYAVSTAANVANGPSRSGSVPRSEGFSLDRSNDRFEWPLFLFIKLRNHCPLALPYIAGYGVSHYLKSLANSAYRGSADTVDRSGVSSFQ